MLLRALFILFCLILCAPSAQAAACLDVFPSGWRENTPANEQLINFPSNFSGATLTDGTMLPRGDNLYNNSNLGNKGEVYVSGLSGSETTARLFFRSNVSWQNVKINENGDPEDLIIVIDGGLQVTGGSTVINAIIYVKGTTSVNGNPTINGAAATVGSSSAFTVNYSANYISNADFNGMCDTSSPPLTCSETGYIQVYGLNIDNTNLHNNVPYTINNASSIANDSFNRIAYQVELQKQGGSLECIWVSTDAFTQDASLIGIPSIAGSNTSFQQTLTNMNVISNKVGIVTGVGIPSGNIEFWPFNYGTRNINNIPSASDNTYDTGDTSSNSSSYGSMQIHNHGANQTLFALNRFSGSSNKDLGIGSQSVGHPDWTFAGNSGQYSIKNINVYVSSEGLASKPIVDYRFDDCSFTVQGDEVDDEIGSFNGIPNGVPDPIDDDIVNKSLDLSANDTSDWIYVPNGAVNGLNDFSVSVWFKTSIAKPQQEIFHALGSSTSDDELEIYLRNSDIVYIKVRGNSQELTSNIALTDGDWHHLVLARVDKNVCLFIDGTKQQCNNSVDAGVLSVTRNNAVVIGQEQDSFGGGFEERQNFQGWLDEFKIYDTKLSETEINILYQNELAGNNYDGTLRDPAQCDDQCDATPGLLNAVGIKIGGGSNSQINTTTEALAIHAAWLSAGSPASGLIGGGTYNVSASGSNTVDRIDFGGSSHDFSGTLTYPGVGAGVSGSDFLVHTSGTLSLPAGTYTIYVEADDGFSFIMDTLSGDAVSFNKFGSSTSGQSNELRFENPTANSNTGGSFTLTEDSIFNIASVFFERGGGDYLEISISNDIRSNAAPSGYEILKHGALGGKVKFGDCVDPSQIDHYQIIHDGNGLTCTAEDVIIKACTNTYDGTCTLSEEPVTLVVNTTGSDIATDTITFTGEGTANLAYTKSESTILSIVDASVIPTSSTVCFDGSTTSCNLFFADTGFRFFENLETNPIPTQVSAKPSNTLKIQAIEKNPDTGACQAAFIDTTTIEMAATCVDPIACAGSQVAINNLITTDDITTLNKNSVLSYSPVNLNFSDDTVNSADFIFTYPDAGKVQLHARYNIPDENGDPSGNYMLGSSNEFVVRPFGFFIDVVGNPKAQSANQLNSVFKKAGEDFTTSLTAVQWQADDDTDLSNNLITKNFGNEQAPETAKISPNMVLPNLDTLPNAGVLGNLTNVTFDTFSAGSNAEQGIATNDNMTYSEVGIISFTANLTDNSYLGADDVVGSEPYVGRFIPDHFILDKIDGDLAAICDSGSSLETMPFAYSGQMSIASPSTGGAIRYGDSLNPSFTITAMSVNGDNTTLNYTGDFMKLVSDSIIRKTIIDGANTFFAPIMDGKKDGSLGTKLTLTSDLKVVSTASLQNNEANGVVTYTYESADNFVYHHVLNAEIEKFTADINLPIVSVIDSDDVTAKDADGDFDNDGDLSNALDSVLTLEPTGVEIRFGRAQLENSYGPDTSDLSQVLSINYYTNDGYVLSETDTCTTFNSDNITLTDKGLGANKTDVKAPVSGKFFDETPKGETRKIILTAPTTGPSDINTGQVGVIYTINDWLKYDWDYDDEGVDGLYDDNPFGVATFGIYRGNDRIIYQREISR